MTDKPDENPVLGRIMKYRLPFLLDIFVTGFVSQYFDSPSEKEARKIEDIVGSSGLTFVANWRQATARSKLIWASRTLGNDTAAPP